MRHAFRQLLRLASILALIGALSPSPAPAADSSTAGFLVNPEWLAARSGDPTLALVDMRPSEAYADGHIPGAINLPWTLLAQPNTDDAAVPVWQEQMALQLGSVGISPNDTVVSYDDNGNPFAARLRWLLKSFGQESAMVLDGGLSAWTQFGGSLSTEPTTRAATTYAATPKPELLATWKYVLENLDNSRVQILDVRPYAAYTGEAASADLHTGHIPGALNLDWNELLQAQAPRTFKSLDQLQARFDAIGLQRDKEIIVYCVTGVASADALLALGMLAYPDVRLYSASWAEWGNRADLPITRGPQPGLKPHTAGAGPHVN